MAKVCYISPLSIHSLRWMEAFSQRDYDLSLIKDSLWNYGCVIPKSTSIRVYALPTLTRTNFPRRFVSNYFAIMKILKRIAPDFVHLHVQHHYWPVIVKSGFPFILTAWGGEVLRLLGTNIFRKSLAKSAAHKAHMITVDAKCLKDIWVNMGVPEDKIRVIPFGVDVDLFNPNVDGRSIREEFRISKKDIVVISTRAFYNDHYNLECLIEAIPSIIEACENVKFIMKGSGPLERYLKNLAKKLGVKEHVHFHGVVPHNKMPQFLSAADIYVSTCFFDTTSVSLLEAMACKLAPVVTDILGNREWIRDGVNGFLFPPRNKAVLAEKIIRLAENHKLRDIFSRRCVDIVEKRARWEHCVSKMQAIYETLLKR
ncbi:MAG: glycosyltransferase family 4 protein [Promethearchaeota archaeon]